MQVKKEQQSSTEPAKTPSSAKQQKENCFALMKSSHSFSRSGSSWIDDSGRLSGLFTADSNYSQVPAHSGFLGFPTFSNISQPLTMPTLGGFCRNATRIEFDIDNDAPEIESISTS